jgi:TonB family protein
MEYRPGSPCSEMSDVSSHLDHRPRTASELRGAQRGSSTLFVLVSLAIHLPVLLVLAWTVRPNADAPSRFASLRPAYQVELSAPQKNQQQKMRVVRRRARIGMPLRTRQNADSLDERSRGVEAGKSSTTKSDGVLQGANRTELRAGQRDHFRRHVTPRIKRAASASAPDNRRAVTDPQNDSQWRNGRGDQRVSVARRSGGAAGPRALRSRVGGSSKALEQKGDRLTEPSPGTRRSEGQKNGERSDGEIAAAKRRPREARDEPSVSVQKHGERSDDRQRSRASNVRVPDVTNMARPNGSGEALGKGKGATARRWGSTGDRGKGVYLTTRDERYIRYFRHIHRKIQPLWRFPKKLEILMEQGEVLVEFAVRADGSVANVRLRRSSGHPAFDRNALAAVRKASPFNRIPTELGASLLILAPFEFRNPLIR